VVRARDDTLGARPRIDEFTHVGAVGVMGRRPLCWPCVALEGRCFVLSCNQFTRRGDFPDDIPNALAEAPDDVVSTGGSCIISPLGEVLAGPARDGEEILFADIELDDITRGKFDFDVAGHYARPDVFRLVVDEAPKPPVSPAQ
jgi:nitrilase